ncbi:MAG: DUF362 domain-containing protein [Candidatus Margulisiibacteriota bacterium]
MPKVSLTRCATYNQPEVDAALQQLLEPLGGMAKFVRPGQKVLIKPNALLGETPEHAVTTHPAVIGAVVKAVVKAGGIALVGDSPGNAHSNVHLTMEKTGFKVAAESNGGQLVYFQHEGVVELPSPSHSLKMPSIRIAKAVLDADVIINLPKLKTHGLTLYTGAIKNMFGSVPGFHKTSYHTACPRARDFAAAIVDIYQITKPALNIMDAIVGMEGPGPNSGDPRKMGLLIASTDGVAMDAIGSYLIGYEPSRILTTLDAHQRGLGEIDLKKIEIIGPELAALRQADWRKSFSNLGLIGELPDWLIKLLSPLLEQIKIYPVIDQSKCTKCLVCVNNCPAKTIKKTHPLPKQTGPSPSLNKRGGVGGGELVVWIDQKNCISCFCCHELCQYKAIELQRSWLVRLLKLG